MRKMSNDVSVMNEEMFEVVHVHVHAYAYITILISQGVA